MNIFKKKTHTVLLTTHDVYSELKSNHNCSIISKDDYGNEISDIDQAYEKCLMVKLALDNLGYDVQFSLGRFRDNTFSCNYVKKDSTR